MTSAIAAGTESQSALEQGARVRPSTEFLLVGGATLFLFPLLWLLRRVLGLDSAELAVGFLMFHGAHLINDPHFAVSYLLFYKDLKQRAFGQAFAPWQRARYWFAGLFVPLGLTVWLLVAWSSASAKTLGWLIQAMFLLVGWHYVKQGFGVLSVLSARHGVRYSSFERRAILGHCFAGWAYAWASPAMPTSEAEEKGVLYWQFAHPKSLEQFTLVLFGVSALVLGFALFRKWRREARWPPLSPLTGLLVSIWVWSVYSSADPLLVYVIPALHSVQYLYFVWILTHNQAKARELPPHFGPKAGQRVLFLALSSLALGWFLFHLAPDAFDAARLARHRHARLAFGELGPTPYFAGFFAFVNIHHYFMDSVLWRRENPDTRYLQR